MHVAVAALVFDLARRRASAWAAAGVAVLVLFLGRAWETLLFPGCLSLMLPTLGRARRGQPSTAVRGCSATAPRASSSPWEVLRAGCSCPSWPA